MNSSTDIINVDVGLGGGLEEDRGLAHGLGEVLPLLGGHHALVLHVALVPHHHDGRQVPRVVGVLTHNTTLSVQIFLLVIQNLLSARFGRFLSIR